MLVTFSMLLPVNHSSLQRRHSMFQHFLPKTTTHFINIADGLPFLLYIAGTVDRASEYKRYVCAIQNFFFISATFSIGCLPYSNKHYNNFKP